MIDMLKIGSLFSDIVECHKKMSKLINELYMEVYKENSTSDIDYDNLEIKKNDDYKFEICKLIQHHYNDRFDEWIENEFVPTKHYFMTENESIDYVNEVKLDYLPYLHNIKMNTYKRFRKNPEGKYYLKR